jgi:hypothetical protein
MFDPHVSTVFWGGLTLPVCKIGKCCFSNQHLASLAPIRDLTRQIKCLPGQVAVKFQGALPGQFTQYADEIGDFSTSLLVVWW